MGKPGKWFIGLIISTIALILVFWGVQPERMLNLFAGAEYVYLIPIEILLILGLAARSMSWKILLGDSFPLTKVFNVVNIGYLLNAVMPLRLGELGRALIISREREYGMAKVLGTIMIERLLDTLISFSALLISLPLVIIPDWAENLTWVVGISILVILIVSFILLYRRAFVLSIVERFSRIGQNRLTGMTEEFIDGLETLIQPLRILRAGIWSLLAWISYWVELWFLITILGAPVQLGVLLFVPSVVAFGSALPPSPGAIGVFEITAVAGLLVFGYEREIAVSVAILWHGLHLLTTALLGGWGLSAEGQSLLEIVRTAQKLLRNRKVDNLA